jgi:glycosyltransferase involved in cell wall biosynthesis
MERKKKIVLHSNSCLANTGFGRHMKFLLSYLFRTGKYELVEYAGGSFTWSDNNCKSMPWKCYGCLPDNPRELDQFRGDASKMQAIQYGDYNINKVLETEKPDALIMLEDIWGMPYFDKPWINKFPHVFWTPIDSLPLLKVFKEQKDKFGNLWVKAQFAKDALAEQGVNSEYMPALIEDKNFKILSKEEKKSIRRKFGIADNTFLFGFVFRNQLRKLVGTLIEAFSIFKKSHPEIDCKLFLHTNWSEGWRIPEFIERFGVRRDDVLTTYVCSACKDVSVKPFFGQELNCQNCQSEKKVNTTNVSVGVEEEDLCELYNMCDAYIHPATSGGFEMPVLEALFCGLPVATTNYSYGTNFTVNPEVFPLDFTLYREHGSQFDKAQVLPSSIVEFMEKITSLSKEEIQQKGYNLRQWALENFDGNKICAKIEKFIDDLPFTDYDFSFNKETQDEAQSKTLPIEDIIDFESSKKRILYVEDGNLGYCVDSIAVLQRLETKFPKSEWDYYVSTLFPQMFEHLDFIKKAIPCSPVFDDVLGMEGVENHKGFFDMAFHPKITRNCVDFMKNNF